MTHGNNAPWPPPARPPVPPVPPGYGGDAAGGVPLRLQHSPGKGLAIGLAGILALLLSYFALPWISEGGQDVMFEDIRQAFHPEESSTATIDAGAASSDDDTDELEAYTDWGWTTVLYLSIAGVVFAAWLVPRDRVGRLVTGTLTIPCLGWVNLFDREGASAPRVLSTLGAAFVVLEVVGNAYNIFWDGSGAPDPAIGAWLGVAGSIAVLVACVIGTEREWVPDHR